MDFGAAAADFDEGQVTLAWYDFLFKGVQNGFAKKPVRIFVMGANEWRDEDSWPPQRAKAVSVSAFGQSREFVARRWRAFE